jgi:sec-independent protein translocase protein TatA
MGIGIWELVIIFMILLLIFGSKRLGNIGKDLGSAIKGFKESVSDSDSRMDGELEETKPSGRSKPQSD